MSAAKFQIYCSGFLIVVFVLLASCNKKLPDSSGLYAPTENDTTANATLEELLRGRDLYIDNCGECHDYYMPENLSKTQWSSAMSKMVPKTNLNNSEAELVTKYVTKGK